MPLPWQWPLRNSAIWQEVCLNLWDTLTFRGWWRSGSRWGPEQGSCPSWQGIPFRGNRQKIIKSKRENEKWGGRRGKKSRCQRKSAMLGICPVNKQNALRIGNGMWKRSKSDFLTKSQRLHCMRRTIKRLSKERIKRISKDLKPVFSHLPMSQHPLILSHQFLSLKVPTLSS